MKKNRSLLALLLSVLLVLGALTGCSASAKMESAASDQMAPMADAPAAEAPAPMPEAEEYKIEEESLDFSTTTSDVADDAMAVEEVQSYSDKIIYSGHVYMETTEFDAALANLDRAVASYGGFIQESSVNGNTRYNEDGSTTVVNRWGYYVVRIPSAKFSAFMQLADGIGNVISSSRTAENVTSQYTDYEARLSSLYIQEERLLDMLEESGDLESLIQLEARLSEVRSEIERIERNLRDLDQRLAYSTVTLELQEVEIYTPTVAVQRTFGEKMADALSDGWRSFVRGLQNFLVSLTYSLPTLILLAVIAVAAVIVVLRLRRRRKAKKQAKQQAEQSKDEQ